MSDGKDQRYSGAVWVSHVYRNNVPVKPNGRARLGARFFSGPSLSSLERAEMSGEPISTRDGSGSDRSAWCGIGLEDDLLPIPGTSGLRLCMPYRLPLLADQLWSLSDLALPVGNRHCSLREEHLAQQILVCAATCATNVCLTQKRPCDDNIWAYGVQAPVTAEGCYALAVLYTRWGTVCAPKRGRLDARPLQGRRLGNNPVAAYQNDSQIDSLYTR